MIVIFTPALRKASSLKRLDKISKENSTVSKIESSGQKVTFVPFLIVSEKSINSVSGIPHE